MTVNNLTLIEQDQYAQSLGVKLVDSGEEYALCDMKINSDHYNHLGTLHGAVIFSLADIALAVACSGSRVAIGIQAEIKFLNQATGDTLIAEAKVVSASNKIGSYQVKVTDSAGTHVAQFSSMTYRFPKKD